MGTDRRVLPPQRNAPTLFLVGGLTIRGQAAMIAKCQEIMDSAPWSGADRRKEFPSAILSDLIANYHYFCPLFNLKPDRFRKDPPSLGYRGYTLMGHFEGVAGDGWHGVSWRKCIKHPNFESEVVGGFRRIVAEDMDSLKGPRCQRCRAVNTALELDHSNPTFHHIMAQLMPLFTEEERRNWCGFDWRVHEHFTLPGEHPAMMRFQELHRESTLTTLCHPCHVEMTRIRGEL